MGLCFGLTPGWEGGCCLGPAMPGMGVHGKRRPWLPCEALPCCLPFPGQGDLQPGGSVGNLHCCDGKLLAIESFLRHVQPQENKRERSLC